jgi:hypothetical protein
MNIEVVKYELINKLTSTTDESLLEQLLVVFNKFSNKNEQISIVQYNKELEASEARIVSGKFTNHDDLELESKEW